MWGCWTWGRMTLTLSKFFQKVISIQKTFLWHKDFSPCCCCETTVYFLFIFLSIFMFLITFSLLPFYIEFHIKSPAFDAEAHGRRCRSQPELGKLERCRVPGRQDPAAVTSMWLAGGDGAECVDCLFLWLGPMSLPNCSPQGLTKTNLRHAVKEETDVDKRKRDARGGSELKRMKGLRQEGWCKSYWELFHVLTERQLSVKPTPGRLTFNCVSVCSSLLIPSSQTIQHAVQLPLGCGCAKPTHFTPCVVIKVLFKHTFMSLCSHQIGVCGP